MANPILETLKGRFATKDMISHRRSICQDCPLKDGLRCAKEKSGLAVTSFKYEGEFRNEGQEYSGCGCFTEWKTTLINFNCPLGKW